MMYVFIYGSVENGFKIVGDVTLDEAREAFHANPPE